MIVLIVLLLTYRVRRAQRMSTGPLMLIIVLLSVLFFASAVFLGINS